MEIWHRIVLGSSDVFRAIPPGAVVCTAAAVAASAVAIGSLLRHRPAPVRWLILPGLLLAALPLETLACCRAESADPAHPWEHALRGASELMLILAIGWTWMPALAAPAAMLRPGDAAHPTPGRALVEIAVAWAASVAVFALAHPLARTRVCMLAAGPTLVVLLAVRGSDRLRRARRDAALVQLAGAAWLAAPVVVEGAGWWLGQSPMRTPIHAPVALPALALSVVGFVHAGLPARRHLAAALIPPVVVSGIVAAGSAWLDSRLERELAAMDPRLVEVADGGRPLPEDTCWVRPGEPRCEGAPVWLAAPDQPVTDAVAAAGPGEGLLAIRTDGGVRGVSLWVPDGDLRDGPWLTLQRAGTGVGVGDRVVDLEAAAAELEAAGAACYGTSPVLDPLDRWTAAEVATLCRERGCALVAGAAGSCVWHDDRWTRICPAGRTCATTQGWSTWCRGGGCTVVSSVHVYGHDPSLPARILCPDGRCTIHVPEGLAEVSCAGGCTVYGDPARVTCLEGPCRFQ